MVICLGRCADLHMAQLIPLPISISCSSKSRLVLPFWHRLTRVVPDKGPLNGCCCCCTWVHFAVWWWINASSHCLNWLCFHNSGVHLLPSCLHSVRWQKVTITVCALCVPVVIYDRQCMHTHAVCTCYHVTGMWLDMLQAVCCTCNVYNMLGVTGMCLHVLQAVHCIRCVYNVWHPPAMPRTMTMCLSLVIMKTQHWPMHLMLFKWWVLRCRLVQDLYLLSVSSYALLLTVNDTGNLIKLVFQFCLFVILGDLAWTGSVLGPLLFAVYASSLAAFAQFHGMQQQQYADDTQLYIALTPSDSSSELAAIKSSLASSQLWFYTNSIEILINCTPFFLAELREHSHSDVAGSATSLDSHIKLLGVTLDSHLSMSERTKLVSQSCFYHIWALHHIRGVLDLPTATAIASALISSWLDYANFVLFDSPSKNRWNRQFYRLLLSAITSLKFTGRVFKYHRTLCGLSASALLHVSTSLLQMHACQWVYICAELNWW